MRRREFLKTTFVPALSLPIVVVADGRQSARRSYAPGRIPNEYTLFLPGERATLESAPEVTAIEPGAVRLKRGAEAVPGQEVNGWVLLAVHSMNGSLTAVFEKQVTHRGEIVYITQEGGVILRISKQVGDISRIRPRPIDAPHIRFTRQAPYRPSPDRLGEYILRSDEDPCYENVAALGAEYTGWTLVGNEVTGPEGSLFLAEDGSSRELAQEHPAEASWAPDQSGPIFDPVDLLTEKYPELFRYLAGFSKRTFLGGFLPVANTAIWNPETKSGYEVLVLLSTDDNKPMARVRGLVPGWAHERSGPGEYVRKVGENVVFDRYWNTHSEQFYAELAGIANRWQHFCEDRMKVEIPDPWLLDAARAGIMLARCSYHGLRPTYQIGEGAYTKIPERSHALFPVAHYEFVWAHQLWNLTDEVECYFQFYLDNYILPDGNFLYNTQDQVEAPLNTGVFLWNSARAYDYTHNIDALQHRLPVLRRMIQYVLRRYEYSLREFVPNDRRHGLIWGSPEADLGEPSNDFPNSHPYYFQNAAWTWRGLKEHARCLQLAAREHNLAELAGEGEQYARIAGEMRDKIERSLAATIADGSDQIRAAGISPFTSDDTNRTPTELSSYENHRFMMDWFTADWGDEKVDIGHLHHREISGLQILGLATDGEWSRTSNFMEHGTLAVRIRQDDYRPFLLTLYALCCYAADSGNRYSPEDALLPGSYPQEGNKYGWAAVVNSVLQPSLGLRWLLCYEESDNNVCHLQKAAPKHWFAAGERIFVQGCPTRFGALTWTTEAVSNAEWHIKITADHGFAGKLFIHVHAPDGRPLASTTVGRVRGDHVELGSDAFTNNQKIEITVRT